MIPIKKESAGINNKNMPVAAPCGLNSITPRWPRNLDLPASPVRLLIRHLSIIFLFCMIVAPAVPASSTGSKSFLAVLDIELGVTLDEELSALLADRIRSEIANTDRYEVLERGPMSKRLNKQSALMARCVSRECAFEAGRLLGVEKVVIGSLRKTGEKYYLSLSRLNVGTESVESVVDDKCIGGKEELLRLSESSARKLIGIAVVSQAPPPLPEDERFVFNDLTAFDKDTKLVWLRDAAGAGKSMTWDEAIESIQRLNRQNYAEYADWRLPTKDELATLVEYAKGQGMKRNLNELFTKIGFLNLKADYYWSGTASTDVGGLAWVFDMYTGEMSTAHTSTYSRLWPVRKGPRPSGDRASAH